MKVFPSLVKEQTFTLSELASAIELVRDQRAIIEAHANHSLPEITDDLVLGHCPACVFRAHKHLCYVCGTIDDEGGESQSTHTNDGGGESQSDTSTTDSIDTAPALVVNTVAAPTINAAPIVVNTVAAPTINAAPVVINAAAAPTIRAAAPTLVNTAVPTTQHSSTSASVRWYVITVGRETGVFQGWHNVHVHVVGVPGACFARYSSLAVAQAAYGQALDDGAVNQVPL
ncbi:hypothetical protein DEU56DRAFT_912787 [Suillus clintonianus]|uniref:uncharacterized protein n=1 Tax=Suillus clintonianus TaxID=1904413 RepID=UPI001B886851|nr:uncharacterized protein DEU56DRAFT_912787 [Suillus clintonianus]KAG2137015.1 hypothetical protein DEU56DRAFT_912787 [Suillus clintonianus]